MIEIRKTERFTRWIDGLRDVRARARILVRLERVRTGNFGDVESVGRGVSELRIDYGPGYRVYFVRKATDIVILLVGGTKKTQVADIKRAIVMAKFLRESDE